VDLPTRNFLLIALILVPFVVLVGIHGRRREARHRRALLTNSNPAQWAFEWAAAYGWNFQPEQPLLDQRWHGESFTGSIQRSYWNVFTGQYRGRHCLVFTLRWLQGYGKELEGFDRAIYAVFLGAAGPLLTLEPGRINMPMERLTGDTDIQFESVDFNHKWNVRCYDKRFAYGFINPAVIEVLLRPDFPRGHYQVDGADLLYYAVQDLSPATILPTFDRMIDVVERVPEHIFEPYRRPGWGGPMAFRPPA
jgi:hypothetical protein